jgi:hypothetical protein
LRRISFKGTAVVPFWTERATIGRIQLVLRSDALALGDVICQLNGILHAAGSRNWKTRIYSVLALKKQIGAPTLA